MKKIFSFMLIAAGLLISGQVKAANNCTWSVDGVSQGAASLETVLTSISDVDGNTGGVYSNKLIEITLTDNVLFSGEQESYQDFGFKKQQNVIIDLGNGNAITGHGFRFKVGNARLEFKGKGSLTHLSLPNRTASMFYATGMDTDDPSYAISPASYIIIGKEVTVTSNGYCAAIMNSGYFGGTTQNKLNEARAYGSRIDVYGKIKSTGSPEAVISILGSLNTPEGNVPVLNLFDGSEVVCDNDHLYTYAEIGTSDDLGGTKSQEYIRAAYPTTYTDYKCAATAVYAAGYGKYNIGASTISGGNGVYIKGGDVTIDGAQIYATATEYWKPICYGSGAIACGSAIVLDNNEGYNGSKNGYMQLEIKGDTYVEALSGSAIEEATTDGKTILTGADIKVESGTFVGSAKQGCINIADELVAQSVKQYESITGGTYSDKTVLSVVNAYPDGNAIVNVVTKPGDETVFVIGNKPAEKEWVTDINSAAAGDYVKLAAGADVTLSGDKAMEYLTITGARKVIVPTGLTLSAGEVVMEQAAVIEVQPGGKFIVNGTNGIVSFNTDNILLKADATSIAIFMLNPLVKANKNPKATVEFVSNSFVNMPTGFQNQRIAIPFISYPDALTSEDNVEVRFMRFNDNTDEWDNLGYLNPTSGHSALDLELLDATFADYLITVYNTTQGKKLIFKGSLVGISSEGMSMKANWWNSFGNSYIAKMDVASLLNKIKEKFSGSSENIAIYYQKAIGNNKFEWKPVSEANLKQKENINVMETFMIKNDGGAMVLDIDYKDLIWTPSQQ